NAESYQHESPLHCAVNHSGLDMVNLLISKGARLDIRNDTGATVLHLAVLKFNKDVVQRLLELGMNPNDEMLMNRKMVSVIDIAKSFGRKAEDILELLESVSAIPRRPRGQIVTAHETNKLPPSSGSGSGSGIQSSSP